MNKIIFKTLSAFILILLIVIGLSGIYTVNTGEVAVISRFGKNWHYNNKD